MSKLFPEGIALYAAFAGQVYNRHSDDQYLSDRDIFGVDDA